MSKLSQEEVQNVARLSRIELSDEETEKFQSQLSEILTYVEQLQKVNTDQVEMTAQVTGLENVWREDEIGGCEEDEKAAALEETPERVGNLVKVKSVL